MGHVSRFKDTLTDRAYGATSQSPVINLAVQGQNGYLTDLMYYPSATDYVTKQLIIKVLQAPAGFSLMPNAAAYHAAYKNIIETMMQSWSGFNRTLTNNVTSSQLGNSGEQFETPARTSRARSQVTSTIIEKDRRPVIRFFEEYVRYLIADPDTGHPLLTGISDQFTDQLADQYAGTILAFEPDKTFRYVENAFLITNFFPTGDIGENTGSRTMQQDGETKTYNLTWSGFQKVGFGVDKLAQGFLDAMRVTGIDPSNQEAFVKNVDSNISGVQTGYSEQIAAVKRQMLSPPSR